MRDAIRRAQKERAEGRKLVEQGDRGSSYNSHADQKGPTEAEVEAYKLTQIHSSDPMAAYMAEKEKEEVGMAQGKGTKRRN